jgi:hypothetical protein
MAQAPDRPALEPVDDELTPELALVDPELAERARERLDGFAHPEPEPAPVVERIPTAEAAVITEEPPDHETEPAGAAAPRRGRRIGRALVVAAAVLGAVGVAVVVPTLVLEDGTSSPADNPSLAPPQAQSPSASTPEQAGAAEANAPEAPAAGGPRTFGWVPVDGVRHYHVAFFRGKEKIYENWPRGPRLVLQPEWTFKGRSYKLSPGRYRWVVRPGFGNRRTGRYGPAIVDASMLVRR